MEVAGCVLSARVQFDTTRAFCRDYLSEKAPEFILEVIPEDIAAEGQRPTEDGAQYPDAYLETVALQRKLTERLFSRNVLLFHGSVVAVDGAAYLFTAKSGTGKSTHTALWRQELGERAVIVNDDKPFLICEKAGILACGTPWNGKHRRGSNLQVPLKAICILERAAENEIHQISPREALVMLFQQSARPAEKENIGKYLELLDILAAGVRFYRLGCNMEPEAAHVAYNGMK